MEIKKYSSLKKMSSMMWFKIDVFKIYVSSSSLAVGTIAIKRKLRALRYPLFIVKMPPLNVNMKRVLAALTIGSTAAFVPNFIPPSLQSVVVQLLSTKVIVLTIRTLTIQASANCSNKKDLLL